MINLSVHKRYAKAPKINVKVDLQLEIYLSDRQRSILMSKNEIKRYKDEIRQRWLDAHPGHTIAFDQRTRKPFIIRGAGYNDILNDLGVTSTPTVIVDAPGRGWKPKHPFGVDFGLLEDDMDVVMFTAMERLKKQDPEHWLMQHLNIPLPDLPEDPEAGPIHEEPFRLSPGWFKD